MEKVRVFDIIGGDMGPEEVAPPKDILLDQVEDTIQDIRRYLGSEAPGEEGTYWGVWYERVSPVDPEEFFDDDGMVREEVFHEVTDENGITWLQLKPQYFVLGHFSPVEPPRKDHVFKVDPNGTPVIGWTFGNGQN